MKKHCYDRRNDIASLHEKCDAIISLLEDILDNPDFLIDRLRKSVERQHHAVSRPPRMRVLHHESR